MRPKHATVGRWVIAASVFCLLGLAGNARAADRYWVGSSATPSQIGEPNILP